MVNLHVTKKLLAKLPIDDNGQLPKHPKTEWPPDSGRRAHNPLCGWHGNLLTLQRRQCILLVHDSTRFPVFIPCLTKPDFTALDYRFADSFMNTLLKCNATENQMDAAQTLLAPLQIDSVCNRSVQGTMNQMNGDVEHHLWFNEVDITEITGCRIGAWLAHRPCTVKGQKDCIWPDRAMLELLDSAPGLTAIGDETHTLPDNVIPITRK